MRLVMAYDRHSVQWWLLGVFDICYAWWQRLTEIQRSFAIGTAFVSRTQSWHQTALVRWQSSQSAMICSMHCPYNSSISRLTVGTSNIYCTGLQKKHHQRLRKPRRLPPRKHLGVHGGHPRALSKAKSRGRSSRAWPHQPWVPTMRLSQAADLTHQLSKGCQKVVLHLMKCCNNHSHKLSNTAKLVQ